MQDFSFTLTAEEKKYLKELVKLALLEEFSSRPVSYPSPPSAKLEEKLGVFVTLKKKGNLRGCIGQIVGQKPLWQSIIEMAKAAAFEDPRFTPVQPEELEELEIEISLLSPLEPVKNLEEIIPGKHGIYLRQGFHSGLLLPQVATEWGFGREEFLQQTCLKAGLKPNCYLDPKTEIYIFQAEVF
ncbi:MAG TPA: hypothetical protein DIT19_00220 [Desulfonauticus sp.]|jgi:hypothetical protein|nr:MAG: AMMECR1 domain protein [Desulfonauticus sp. 38_4375]MDK2921738.1 uncharacterized protein [Desulfonauticus sp.]HCO11637.1 hypothetical protein [Desulfonauticus sp.]